MGSDKDRLIKLLENLLVDGKTETTVNIKFLLGCLGDEKTAKAGIASSSGRQAASHAPKAVDGGGFNSE